MIKKITIIGISCIIIDQVFKKIIIDNMVLNTSFEIIPNFLNITYVQNFGSAWSIFSGNRLFLIAITIFALFILYKYFIDNQKLSRLEIISYGILMGGIFGNLIDRIIYGYVIDYIDFIIFGYDFPVFNFADMCIVISVGLIIINMIIGDENNE